MSNSVSENAVAGIVAALEQEGVPTSEIIDSLLGAVVALAKADPQHAEQALYAASVIAARNSVAGRAKN